MLLLSRIVPISGWLWHLDGSTRLPGASTGQFPRTALDAIYAEMLFWRLLLLDAILSAYCDFFIIILRVSQLEFASEVAPESHYGKLCLHASR